jgi:hypothetical protein
MDYEAWLEALVEAVAEALGIPPIPAALLVGGLAFGLVIAVIGRIAFRMGVWGKAAAAVDQPQQAYTTKTPRQVVREGCAARIRLTCCWTVIVLGILGAIVAYLLLQAGLLP